MDIKNCIVCDKELVANQKKFCSSKCANSHRPNKGTICSFDGCDRAFYALGLCQPHRTQQKNSGVLKPLKQRNEGKPCRFESCVQPSRNRGLCTGHSTQLKRHGVLKPLLQKYRSPTGFCEFPECNEPHRCRGLCSGHDLQRTLGIPLRPTKKRAPAGSGSVDGNGYRTITPVSGGKQVKEHRYIMEQVIGRPLLTSENVHHLNGVKTDNRVANLEIWVTSQPSGQRIPDLVAWAHEILETYES